MPSRTLPSLAITKALPRHVDVLVVGLSESGAREVPKIIGSAFQKRFGMSVTEMATSLGAKTSADSKRTLPAADGAPRIVVVGLGPELPSAEDLRRAAAAGVRQAASLADVDADALSIAVSLGSDDAEELSAVAEGALLGTYDYEPISVAPNGNSKINAITVIHAGDVKGDAIADAATIVVQAVVTARDWVNIPANLLYPESFANQVRGLVRGSRIAIDVLDETALSRDGYGGLMAVGGGSARPPRLVRLSYRPRGATFHLALVGKGITFEPQTSRGHVHHEMRYGWRRGGIRCGIRNRPTRSQDQHHCVRSLGGEHAVRKRLPTIRRVVHLWRQDRRERQFRRGGSPGHGRRNRSGQRRQSRHGG